MHFVCEIVSMIWLMNHNMDIGLMWHVMCLRENMCCLIVVDVHVYASGACCGLMNMIIVALCGQQVMIID